MVDVREGYNEEIHKNLNGRFYEGRNESIWSAISFKYRTASWNWLETSPALAWRPTVYTAYKFLD
jgi:hypothetical protein